MSAELTTEQRLRDAVAPLKEPLSTDKQHPIEPYKSIMKAYPLEKILEGVEYDISDFAKRSPTTSPFLAPGDTISWKGVFRLAEEVYIDDMALAFLQKYVLSLIPDDLTDGLFFANPVATADLFGDGCRNDFKVGGRGFTRANMCRYRSYFGKDNKFSDLTRVYLPFHVNDNHFVGAIISPSTGRVSTFDSFGKGESSHEDVFQIVTPMLDHALVTDRSDPVVWHHKILDVPKQNDGISCGLFRSFNGILLTVVEDPASQEVREILFTQGEIEILRDKLLVLILELCSIKTPENVRQHMLQADTTINETKTAMAKAMANTRSTKKKTKTTTLVEDTIDLSISPPRTMTRTMTRAQNSASKQTSAKSESATATVSSTTSSSTVSSMLQKALSSTESRIQFAVDVKNKAFDQFKMQCDFFHHFPIFGQSHPCAEEIRRCFNPSLPSFNKDVKAFTTDFITLCHYFKRHCEQVLSLYDVASQVYTKFTTKDESFCEVFAEYLLATLVSIERATLRLDAGAIITRADNNGCPLSVDLILQKDQQHKLLKLYSSMITRAVRKTSVATKWTLVGGWIAGMHDIAENINRHVLHTLKLKLRSFVTVSTSKGVMSVSYAQSNGKSKTFEGRIFNLSSTEYAAGISSRPEDIGYYDYRFKLLRVLHDKCIEAKVSVPANLLSALQEQFSNSTKVVAALSMIRQTRKHIRCDSDSEEEEEEEEAATLQAEDLEKEATVTPTDVKKALGGKDAAAATKAVATSAAPGNAADDVVTANKAEKEQSRTKKPANAADDVVTAAATADLEKEATVTPTDVKKALGGKDAAAATEAVATSAAPGNAADDVVTADKAEKEKSRTKKPANAADDVVTAAAATAGDKAAADSAKEATIATEQSRTKKKAKKKKGGLKRGQGPAEGDAHAATSKSVDSSTSNKKRGALVTEADAKASTAPQAITETAKKKRKQSLLLTFMEEERPTKRKGGDLVERGFVRFWGGKYIKFNPPHNAPTSKRSSTAATNRQGIGYKPCGNSLNIHVEMVPPPPKQSKDAEKNNDPPLVTNGSDEDVTKLFVSPAATAATTAINSSSKRKLGRDLNQSLRKKNSDGAAHVDIFEKIEAHCILLRKSVDSKPRVLREDLNQGLFQHVHSCPARAFIIDEVDPIEVIDHIRTNETKSKLLVRMSFPMQTEHELLKTLQKQVDAETYNTLVDTAKKVEGLILIAFTSVYGDDLIGQLQNVEQVLFHSLIVMKKPSTTTEKAISVPVMWTSKEYNGALLDRLMQIGCILFWKDMDSIPLQITGHIKDYTKLEWKTPKENVEDILLRVGFCSIEMTDSHRKWVDKARQKVCDLTNEMIANLEALLQPPGGSDVQVQLKVPLAFFTHYICGQSTSTRLDMTEIGVELLQIASIVMTTSNTCVMHCSCCGSNMNTPVDLVALISLATRIISHHYLGCDVELEPLGKVRSTNIPPDFAIHHCSAGEENSLKRRMRVFDAIKIDTASSEKRRETLICNTLGLASALLPIEPLTDKDLDDFPLAKELFNMVQRLMGGNFSDRCVLEGQSVQDMKCVLEGRPIQVPLTDISVDPISSLTPHESWKGCDEGRDKSTEEFARPREKTSFKVGGLDVDEGAITASTPQDNQGDLVLSMLSYYWARFVVRIDEGMTFGELTKALKGHVRLPPTLQNVMDQNVITTTLVVISEDLFTKKTLSGKSMLQSHLLTPKMKANVSWFVPTQFFLHLLPKADIESLYDGTSRFVKISDDLRNQLRGPIDRSLQYELKRIQLFSKSPNWILEVTLKSDRRIYINANDAHAELAHIQEKWLLECLSSLIDVSGSRGVTIGTGKKATVAQRQISYNPIGANFWYDSRNQDNLCVGGGMVNWAYAEGLHVEANKMKEWLQSQHLFTSDDDSMKKALLYMHDHLHIGNVQINFFKSVLTLHDTVLFVREFPAPTLLEFQCQSTYLRHSVVVSTNNVVFDFQDSHPYELTLPSLTRKLNGDNDVVCLVSARYFFLKRPKLMSLPSCPIIRINTVPSSCQHIIRSLGERRKKKTNRNKKKNQKKK